MMKIYIKNNWSLVSIFYIKNNWSLVPIFFLPYAKRRVGDGGSLQNTATSKTIGI